jgi:hypothetical protein
MKQTDRYVQLWRHVAEFFLDWETFQIEVVETMETQFYVRVLYEIMWENMAQPDRPQSQYGTAGQTAVAIWHSRTDRSHNMAQPDNPQSQYINTLLAYLQHTTNKCKIYSLLNCM